MSKANFDRNIRYYLKEKDLAFMAEVKAVDLDEIETKRHRPFHFGLYVRILEDLISRITTSGDFAKQKAAPTPPSPFILSWLMPASKSEDAIACMEAIYEKNWLPRYGTRRAKLIWYTQCAGTIIGHHKNAIVAGALAFIKRRLFLG